MSVLETNQHRKWCDGEDGAIRKMVALSKCCFVTEIPGWGRIVSGRKDLDFKEDNVDITNDL